MGNEPSMPNGLNMKARNNYTVLGNMVCVSYCIPEASCAGANARGAQRRVDIEPRLCKVEITTRTRTESVAQVKTENQRKTFSVAVPRPHEEEDRRGGH